MSDNERCQKKIPNNIPPRHTNNLSLHASPLAGLVGEASDGNLVRRIVHKSVGVSSPHKSYDYKYNLY